MYPNIYKIQDLGILPGGSDTTPNSINNRGYIVGSTRDNTRDWQGFIWKNGVLTKLPLPRGFSSSNATDINSTGQIVGVFERPTRAAYWNNNVPHDIGQGVHSIAHSINDAGKIAGTNLSASLLSQGCVWINNVKYILNTINGYGQSFDSIPHSVISNGKVFGTTTNDIHGVASKWSITGVGNSLDVPESNFPIRRTSATFAANDSEIAVGYIKDGPIGDTILKAYFWSPFGKGALATLPGTFYSVANDINSYAQIVGYILSSGSKAVIWNGSVVTDLNSFIDPASGWILTEANCINDRGQIAGIGKLNGQSRGWLLSPISGLRKRFGSFPEPPLIFWHIIYGIVNDRPGVIIGPRGPVPVPPWNPLLKNVQEPYKSILQGMLQQQKSPGSKKITKNKK
jgi:uncharacterized membrane protein